MMASVVHAIQDLGIEVEHIPGGCTSKCQPLDVGVNKPIKTNMKNQWEDWMLLEGLMDGVTKPPPCDLVVMWTISAFNDVTKKKILKTNGGIRDPVGLINVLFNLSVMLLNYLLISGIHLIQKYSLSASGIFRSDYKRR
jgi:hypothetical protein